ncbi:c-type cytochrome [Hydrogenimonas urashimensis]|uniref:c-type cytochrome n=1 Tax=Hydrogenimonas urashimensis TaxID=2740515 RepID=UPI001F242B25|nr:c-type cytochrome [Hydrogenimonas urashimensis]
MKKRALAIAVTALVLMSGCGEKKSETKSHEAAPVAKSETTTVKPEKKEESAKPEKKGAETAATPADEAAAAAKESAQKEVANVAESVAQGEAEAKESIEKKAEEVKSQIDVATLFTKCAGCHGMKGEKHALGKSNIIAGQPKEELVKKIKGYQDGSYGGAMKAMMAGQVKGLNADQIDALADYISKM